MIEEGGRRKRGSGMMVDGRAVMSRMLVHRIAQSRTDRRTMCGWLRMTSASEHASQALIIHVNMYVFCFVMYDSVCLFAEVGDGHTYTNHKC